MTGNEKFDNDVGRVNTRFAFLVRKHSDQKESMVLSKEKSSKQWKISYQSMMKRN